MTWRRRVGDRVSLHSPDLKKRKSLKLDGPGTGPFTETIRFSIAKLNEGSWAGMG